MIYFLTIRQSKKIDKLINFFFSFWLQIKSGGKKQNPQTKPKNLEMESLLFRNLWM